MGNYPLHTHYTLYVYSIFLFVSLTLETHPSPQEMNQKTLNLLLQRFMNL